MCTRIEIYTESLQNVFFCFADVKIIIDRTPYQTIIKLV